MATMSIESMMSPSSSSYHHPSPPSTSSSKDHHLLNSSSAYDLPPLQSNNSANNNNTGSSSTTSSSIRLAPLLHAASSLGPTNTSSTSASSSSASDIFPPFGYSTSPYSLSNNDISVSHHQQQQQQQQLHSLQRAGEVDPRRASLPSPSPPLASGSGSGTMEGGGIGADKALSDGSKGSGGEEGGKQLKNTKRAAQNRAAQRAFRERKDQHIRYVVIAFPAFPPSHERTLTLSYLATKIHSDLEAKAKQLDSTLALNAELTLRLDAIETTMSSYASERASWQLERSHYEEQRRLFENESLRRIEVERELEGVKGALEESRRQNEVLRREGSGNGTKRSREVEEGEEGGKKVKEA